MNSITLVCPETRKPVVKKPAGEAQALFANGGKLVPRMNREPVPVGLTDHLMVTVDGGRAYPIVDGIPVLLGPEVLVSEEHASEVDLSDPRYEEAYMEMDFYNSVARTQADDIVSSSAVSHLLPVSKLQQSQIRAFPEPKDVWLNANFDLTSEYDAYRYIAPLSGKRVMQLGGSGLHAVKFLMAGCEEAWLVSPMIGELAYARALAEYFGVAHRFRCVAGVGEAIPTADQSFDVVYAGGCIHHMETGKAYREIARVLKSGGSFVAVEPWRAPLYGLGTKILGKREQRALGTRDEGVYCRPMNKERVEDLSQVFQTAEVRLHGAITRYLLLAMWKLGLELPKKLAWNIARVDDIVSSRIKWLRQSGSSMVILARRS